jgi:hypothetical protein
MPGVPREPGRAHHVTLNLAQRAVQKPLYGADGERVEGQIALGLPTPSLLLWGGFGAATRRGEGGRPSGKGA